MAGSTALTILDDIAALGDDVAAMTKAATRKTAGIIGDDIALNAKQVIGVRRGRELPVVGKILVGSLINKAILVPAFFGMSLIANGALIPPVLMIGGAYLCYEGAEKLWHSISHKEEHKKERKNFVETAKADPEKSEVEKIKKAIRTDFILSAEIIAIALGSIAVAATSPLSLLASLAAVGVVTSVGVYGVVGAFVSFDDVGLWLANRKGDNFVMDGVRALGHGMVKAMPYMSKTLSVVGTAAMFLVGGGIFLHNIPALTSMTHAAAHFIETLPYAGHLMASITEGYLLPGLAGIAAGAVSLPVIDKIVVPTVGAVVRPVSNGFKKLFGKSEKAPEVVPDNTPEPALENDLAVEHTAQVKAEPETTVVRTPPKPEAADATSRKDFAGASGSDQPTVTAETKEEKTAKIRRMPHFYI